MSEVGLPIGWRRASLASLASYVNGFAFNDQFWSEKGLPIVRIAQITGSQPVVDRYDGQLPNQYRLDDGDLIFSWSGTLAVVRWHGGPAWLNQHLFKVEPRGDVDSNLLFHLLQRSVAEMDKRSHGSTMKHIKRGELAEYAVVLPRDLDEQAALAKVLDTLDTTIRQTEAIIEKLKQVKQGLLHDLLTRGIDANGELRPPQSEAPHLYKASPLGWIPVEWEVAPLLSKIDLPQGQVDPRIAPYPDWTLIAPDHIESATGRLLSCVSAKEQSAISGKYLCAPGDVIYSKIRPYLRKATVAKAHVLCSADMYPFTPHNDVHSEFLLNLLLGERFSRFAESVSMRTGMPKINREELSECSLAWPNLAEQSAILEVLGAMDRKQNLAIIERDKGIALKSGLMDDLLTGRVRVTPLLAQPAGT